jgi:MoxR-like ATPase
MVIATQNPIEMEGTYPLPEAQLDRFFFKLLVVSPRLEELIEIAVRTTTGKPSSASDQLPQEVLGEMQTLVREVCIADHLLEYAARLVLATHPGSEYATDDISHYVAYGASPRAMQALVLGAKVRALLHNRAHVAKEDILAVLVPALQHRVMVNFEGEAAGITSLKILQKLQEKVQ